MITGTGSKNRYYMCHSSQVLTYIWDFLTNIFLNRERRMLRFFQRNYLHHERTFVFDKLYQYWRRYRYFDDIAIALDMASISFTKKRILDVGCGYTSVLNILPKSEKYGTDIVINGLRENKFPLSENIFWQQAAAERQPFDDDYFDLVFCTNGLDHFADPQKAIWEIKRVLKNEGVLVLTLDVFTDDIGHRNYEHPHAYSEEKLLKTLSGFDILFKKMSPINAQFSKYIKGLIKLREGCRELVVLAQYHE